MKKIANFLFLKLSTSITHGQTTFSNTKHLEQYWNYRYALLGDNIDPDYYRWEPEFVEVGTGAGYSVPMTFNLTTSFNE